MVVVIEAIIAIVEDGAIIEGVAAIEAIIEGVAAIEAIIEGVAAIEAIIAAVEAGGIIEAMVLGALFAVAVDVLGMSANSHGWSSESH